jgi:uncharacterized repeat protein (TIGR03803 family)
MSISVSARGMSFIFLLMLVCGFPPSFQTQTYTVLHNFSGGADGASPYAGITIDAAGNLEGTALGGGLGFGTVFRLNYSQGYAFGVLYAFTGGSDGALPYNGIIIGPDGGLYGSTYLHGGNGCGGNGCGTVFSLRPRATICKALLCPWIETGLYTFMGGSDGSEPAQGTNVIFDHAGNIYGTTESGGAYGQGTVYKLTHSGSGWTESVIHNFGAPGDGIEPLHGVVFDTRGNLYGTTSFGGTNNNGAVFQLVPSGSGWTENILVSFSLSGSAGGIPFAGLLIDQSGNLYGATSASDSDGTQPTGYGGGGAVFELMPSGGSWILKVLYNFPVPGGGYHCGPYGNLVMDAVGKLYGTTYSDGAYGYGSVFKLTPASGPWTYTSLHDFCSDGWPCSDGELPSGDLTMDANGNLFGTASRGGTNSNGVVWKITP